MEHRGMKKWRPFATIPEQYIGLKEVINKQLEVDQPVLTEEQMEQINFTLIEALHTNKQVILHTTKRDNVLQKRDSSNLLIPWGICLFLSMKYLN